MADKKFFDTTGGKILLGATTGLAGLGVRALVKKYNEADRGIKKQVTALENQQLAPETTAAYQDAQMLANQGLQGSTIGLMNQQLSRGMAGLSSGFRDRRSFLQGAPQLAQMAQDYGLRMGQMEEDRRLQNKMLGIQAGQQYGSQKLALQQYKDANLFDYWMGKKQALNKTVSGIASGIARIGAAALTGGASEAVGAGSAISSLGQNFGGGSNFGLKGLPSSSSIPTYDFNQGALNIFKPTGLKK